MQPGFDEGYVLGSALGVRAGYLIGIMEGLSEALKKQNHIHREAIFTDLYKDFEISNLMGSEYIKSDGTWKWNVLEEDPTSREVANGHPLILKWRRIVREHMVAAGIARDQLFKKTKNAEVGVRMLK